MSDDYTQIIQGCCKRDADAMRSLYEMTASMAMGVCMRYAGDRSTAQDWMQDGYIRVFEKIGSVKDPARLMSWVYQVMVNICLNQCKKRGRTLYLEELPEEPAPDEPLPYSAEEVFAAMKRLPMSLRTAFNLITVEECDYGEAAKRMGCRESTVRGMHSRACARLREILGREK